MSARAGVVWFFATLSGCCGGRRARFWGPCLGVLLGCRFSGGVRGLGGVAFFLRGRFFLAGAFLRPGGEVGSVLGFFWEEFPEDASGLYHGNPRACPFAKGRRR